MNTFNNFLKKFTVLISFCMFLFCISCKKDNYTATDFKSNFSKKETLAISDLEYWSDNAKEWQITNNRIECLVSNENRKIHLKTRQLGTKVGNLEMTVRLGFFNKNISNLNKNWAGFHIGNNNHFSKNDNIIKKKGINIGMSTNGSLFIGTPSPNHKNSSVINALKNGVDLKISIANNNNTYTIDFAVLEINSGKILSRISKRDVAPEQIIGDLALISSFENVDLNNTNNNRSVWFKDWEIKGTKVTILNQ